MSEETFRVEGTLDDKETDLVRMQELAEFWLGRLEVIEDLLLGIMRFIKKRTPEDPDNSLFLLNLNMENVHAELGNRLLAIAKTQEE